MLARFRAAPSPRSLDAHSLRSDCAQRILSRHAVECTRTFAHDLKERGGLWRSRSFSKSYLRRTSVNSRSFLVLPAHCDRS